MDAVKNAVFRFCKVYNRKKSLVESSSTVTELKRCLSTLDLTFIGIGTTLGSGIYALTGEVARYKAGPAIILSFLIAAIASLLSGLCYAELGARVPKAGSAYLYCYIIIGELCGFFIGWNMVLEYLIGCAVIVRASSSYIDSFANGTIKTAMISTLGEMHTPFLASYFDLLAFTMSLAITVLLSVGVKNSARFNNFCVTVNGLTVVGVIVCGLFYVDVKNWNNFAPYGGSGIVAGAATCFYSFIGFDVISLASEEAEKPGRSIPISMTLTIGSCFLAYVGVSTVITLMVPYDHLDPSAAVAVAFRQRGLVQMAYVIAVGAVMGMIGCSVISAMPLPRLLYALSQDGMIPKIFSRVNQKTNVPVISTVVSGFFVALLSGLLAVDQLVDMLSIGTLFAYSIVDICILVMRYDHRTPKNTSDESSPLIITDKNTDSRRSKKNNNLHINFCIFFIILELIVINIILSKYASKVHNSLFLILALSVACIALFMSTLFLASRPSNDDVLAFKTPLVPWVPVAALFFNIYLMLSLSAITWYRLLFWMAIGILVYFGYSMHHSTVRSEIRLYSALPSSSLKRESDLDPVVNDEPL